jgi:NAD+ kinase
VVPGVDALVITAICPHTLAVRPIVVPGSATVTLELVPPFTDEALVSVDGQVATTLARDDRVRVRRADACVRLIRIGKEGFFARMRRKLQWGDLTDRERS